MKEMIVPLCIPDITKEEVDIVSKVLLGGWLAHGKYNKKFEELFANTLGVENAITMNSCTGALEIALKCSGISQEVIIPSMTFVATANAVINSGCTPVFCDVLERFPQRGFGRQPRAVGREPLLKRGDQRC